AERVRERGPLWHRREWNPRQGNADDESCDDRQDDPHMMDDGWLGPGDDDRHSGAGDARVDTPAGGRGCVHPVEREDEHGRRDGVPQLADAIHHARFPSPGLSVLNIFSIRSVIRKPLTMLVIEAKSAIAPRMRIRSG